MTRRYCLHWLWTPDGERKLHFTHDLGRRPLYKMFWFKGYVHVGDQEYLDILGGKV